MSGPPLARDEAILGFLHQRGPAGSVELAAGLGMVDRTVRYGLRRLINGGYAFSPERGRYRITALGIAALAPVSDPDRKVEGKVAIQPLPEHSPTATPAPTGPGDHTRDKLYARLRRRR